jgi:hypothetical protein
MTHASLKSWRLYGARGKSAAARPSAYPKTPDAYEAGKHRIPLYVALACAAVAFGVPPIE